MTAIPRNQIAEHLGRLPRLLLWVIAARVKTLGLSLAPVAAGSWLAAQGAGWRIDVMTAAMVSAAAIQVGTNLWNDAADAHSGVDGPDRLGPPRLTALGLLDPRRVRYAAAAAFGVASVLGLWLAMIGGWPIVVIGLVSLALGYLYSMGPRPLSGTPLGEALVIGFFGIVAVVGTAHLHGAPITGDAFALGVIIGLPAAAVLLLNNHRDRVGDARAGRRTLAILIGERASRGVFALLLTASFVGALMFNGQCGASLLSMLPAALLGLALVLAMARLPVSASLNRLIPGTAAFQMLILAGLAVGHGFCA